MRRFCITSLRVFLSGLFISSPLKGQPAAQVSGDIDFGHVPTGWEISGVLNVRSTGNSPLVILGVKAGCRCSFRPLDTSAVDPGDSLLLPFTWAIRSEDSTVRNKEVLIFTNASLDPIRRSFTVDYSPPVLVEIRPRAVRARTGRSVSISIRNLTQAALTIGVTQSTPGFSLFSPEPIPAGKVVNIELRSDSKLLPAYNPNSVTLEIFNSEGQTERVTVPVTWGNQSR